MKPDLTVVLPTYNERECLPRVVEEIHQALREIPHEVLVVDDNSPDGTWRWVEQRQETDRSLRLVRRFTQPGLSAAVVEGFRHAKADRWVVMDADGQHDPALLPLAHQALGKHAMVIGSRYAGEGSASGFSFGRWLGSRGATWLAQLVLNVPLSDPMSGYFGIQRRAYEHISSQGHVQGFKIMLALYHRLSHCNGKQPVTCVEFPYRFRNRIAGESKLTARIVWQYVKMLLALRRQSPRPWPEGLPRFLLVGVMGLVVNCAVLGLLVHELGWHYLVSSFLAIQLSIAHNFIWNDRWTFKDRRAGVPCFKRFFQYEVVCAAGMGFNWGALALLHGIGGVALLEANLMGIVVGAALNFSVSKLWAWKRPPIGALQ